MIKNDTLKIFNGKLDKLAYALIISYFLSGCTQDVVYKQSNGSNKNEIYSFSSDQSSPVLIASSADPLSPCGPTNDGRVVYTQLTQGTNGDIYVVNAKDGTGLTQVLATSDDEQCVFVTPNNTVIYEDTVPAWNGRHNIMAIQIGSTIPQPIATESLDQTFRAYAPDQSIIYSRKTPLPAYAFDIMSSKIGGQPKILAQVFPPNYTQPVFNTVTKDNWVIFSESTEYQQGKTSQNIFAIKTDGSNPKAIAQNPPAQEIFCALTSDNRILYTEQNKGVVNGAEVTFGQIFIVNPDGSNRMLISKNGPPDFNDLCVGVTPDNHVIFARAPDQNRNEGQGDIYSIYADGSSAPVFLTSSSSLDKTTPASRVLLRKITATETPQGTIYNVTLISINPDGTGLVSLANNYNLVQGVTNDDRVIFNSQVPGNGSQITMNLFIVPSTGGVTATPIYPTSDTQDFGFIFYR